MLNHRLPMKTSFLWTKRLVSLLALTVASTTASDRCRAEGADEPADVLIKGRIVSREYRSLGGGIERSIVSVSKLPENKRVVQNYSMGEPFEFRLPPGRYQLTFSANGTHGATFHVVRKRFSIPDNKTVVDLGTVDLAASTTTKLYGQAAPELDGVIEWKNVMPRTLKQLRGKVVVLDFWGYYCGICHVHKPDLAKLYSKYRDKNLEVVAIHDHSLGSMEEVDEHMKKVASYQKLHLPIALDGKGPKSAFSAYGIHAVPAVILIDQQGKVVRRFHHAGKPELEKEIARLIAQPMSATEHKKPQGKYVAALKNHVEIVLAKPKQPKGSVEETKAPNSRNVAAQPNTLPVRLKGQPPAWSEMQTVEGIQARLTIDDEKTGAMGHPRIAFVVLQVRNADSKYEAYIRIPNLMKAKLQILDAEGKLMKEWTAGRRHESFVTRAGIPPGCYIGVPSYDGSVSAFGSKGRTFAAWYQAWDLPPGVYTLTGTLDVSVLHEDPKREIPWKEITLKFTPIQFVVPK